VILPERNRKDEPEIPERAREDLRLHYVSNIDAVLDLVLIDVDEASAAQ
jgi:ATP-dependent Lon protease